MISNIGKRIFSGVRSMIKNNIANTQICANSTNETEPLASPTPTTSRIVWLDLEMTGLDIMSDKIMEIACLVTDQDLQVVAECPTIIIHQPEDILKGMNEWCANTHGKSGLSEACRQSTTTIEEAEQQILDFLSQHVSPKKAPLAGNSVYMDRFFVIRHMPLVNQFLHYRIIDVSTVKELCRNWNREAYKNQPEKKLNHRAKDDILESIEELKYYKQHFLNLKTLSSN